MKPNEFAEKYFITCNRQIGDYDFVILAEYVNWSLSSNDYYHEQMIGFNFVVLSDNDSELIISVNPCGDIEDSSEYSIEHITSEEDLKDFFERMQSWAKECFEENEDTEFFVLTDEQDLLNYLVSKVYYSDDNTSAYIYKEYIEDYANQTCKEYEDAFNDLESNLIGYMYIETEIDGRVIFHKEVVTLESLKAEYGETVFVDYDEVEYDERGSHYGIYYYSNDVKEFTGYIQRDGVIEKQ